MQQSYWTLLTLLYVGILFQESSGLFFAPHGHGRHIVRGRRIAAWAHPSFHVTPSRFWKETTTTLYESLLSENTNSNNNNNNGNKPPTLNGKVIFPTKTILQGLRVQSMKVAAVYAILNHQYKRGSGDGWEYCEYVGITKDLQYVLDTYTQRMNPESIAYVKALSFSFPQKSVMEDIATDWRRLAVQSKGPISSNTLLDSWIVIPTASGTGGGGASDTPTSIASYTSDSSISSSSVIGYEEIHSQKTQQLVEFIRSTQYHDDDDEDEEEEDEVHHVQETVLQVMNKTNSVTTVPNIVVSPFMNESNLGRATATPILAEEENTLNQQQEPLMFNAVNVEKVLDEVRPYLISDGGNVAVHRVDVEKNDIYLILEGACGSCSSSTVTMQMGIERTLRENFPDLGQVIQVNQSDISNSDSNKKVDYLTMEAVAAELNRISPAVTAMGAVCDIVHVDPIGVVELRCVSFFIWDMWNIDLRFETHFRFYFYNHQISWFYKGAKCS